MGTSDGPSFSIIASGCLLGMLIVDGTLWKKECFFPRRRNKEVEDFELLFIKYGGFKKKTNHSEKCKA